MRYGYRRVHVLLQREGWEVNTKRIYRLYNELGLQLRNKTPKRRVKAKLRDDRASGDATERDLGDGLRPRPACDRQDDPGAHDRRHVLALLAGDRSAVQLSGRRRGCDARACLRQEWAIRRRSGSTRAREFVSRDLDLWAYSSGVTLDFSRPGKPTDNAFIEAFNGKFRAECLNAHSSRLRDLNRSATNIPSACRIANIALNGAMILSYNANLGRMEFSEGTRCQPRAQASSSWLATRQSLPFDQRIHFVLEKHAAGQ